MVSNQHNSQVLVKTDLFKVIKINIPGVDKALIPFTETKIGGENQSINNDTLSDFYESVIGLI